MAAAFARPQPDEAAPAVPRPIALLRLAALACRAAPRAPLADSPPVEAGIDAIARSLAATLPEALDRRPVLWRPGAAELSFDERWLAAFLTAIVSGDGDSERFLAGRRVRAERREALRALAVTFLAALDFS